MSGAGVALSACQYATAGVGAADRGPVWRYSVQHLIEDKDLPPAIKTESADDKSCAIDNQDFWKFHNNFMSDIDFDIL